MGLFDNSGEILAIAGPGGALLAYGLVGVGVICLMEGIAEMIGHWPISNAMIEFVKVFVDRDLAVVIGLAYWYVWRGLQEYSSTTDSHKVRLFHKLCNADYCGGKPGHILGMVGNRAGYRLRCSGSSALTRS
jgi:amino acid permease